MRPQSGVSEKLSRDLTADPSTHEVKIEVPDSAFLDIEEVLTIPADLRIVKIALEEYHAYPTEVFLVGSRADGRTVDITHCPKKSTALPELVKFIAGFNKGRIEARRALPRFDRLLEPEPHGQGPVPPSDRRFIRLSVDESSVAAERLYLQGMRADRTIKTLLIFQKSDVETCELLARVVESFNAHLDPLLYRIFGRNL